MIKTILRWVAVLPAGIAAAVAMTFIIHWFLIISAVFGDNPSIGIMTAVLSAETVEKLSTAFTTPFFIVYVGAIVAPGHRSITSVTLSIVTAVVMGDLYVFAFTGGPTFQGWNSLYYGATPALNLAGIAVALLAIRRKVRQENDNNA
jgi:hypothetical protein